MCLLVQICQASNLRLAHYLQDGGEFAKEVCDGDIHTKNMQSMGLTDRNQAKTAIYCMIYGGGNQRLGEIAGKGAAEGRIIRDRFLRQTLPLLTCYGKSNQLQATVDTSSVLMVGNCLCAVSTVH